MTLILSALSAVKAANLVKLSPEQKEIVDQYSKKLLRAQYKAHQPRTFELAVKTMKVQLEQLSASLKEINLEKVPSKDNRRREMIQKIENDLKFIENCINGDFVKNYQDLKKGFLQFLQHPESNSVLIKTGELLEKDDPYILTYIENALEHDRLDDEDPQQLANLILLMKLKFAHTSNPVVIPNLSQDVSLLQLEGEIEKQRLIAIIDGQEPLAHALKYLSIGCTVTTSKTEELREAIVKHGTRLQAYLHQDKCRELGGRVVLHCSQAMLPGMGLDKGMCHGLANHWAEDVIKKDSFMGFRGNQEVFIYPSKTTDKILQAIPSFNEFARLDPKIYETQKSQKTPQIHEVEKVELNPEKQFEKFTDRIMLDVGMNTNAATFVSYKTKDSGHVVAIHKRTKPTPQGFLIDYFDANSGWMQFKDDESFKQFFIYYLNDRHKKEKFTSIAFENKLYKCSYSHILDELSEKAPQHTPQRRRAQSLSLEMETSTRQIKPQISENVESVKTAEKAEENQEEQSRVIVKRGV
ncbi:TPA: Dot/Icm T4SS effector Lem8 [Legionella pneumophila]